MDARSTDSHVKSGIKIAGMVVDCGPVASACQLSCWLWLSRTSSGSTTHTENIIECLIMFISFDFQSFSAGVAYLFLL